MPYQHVKLISKSTLELWHKVQRHNIQKVYDNLAALMCLDKGRR